MIASVDESVGRVLKTLDDLQLSQNTLVIFSSDNGGVGGYQREGIKKEQSVTDNAPLRGGKGMLYEGGVRVPFIFRCQGRSQNRLSAVSRSSAWICTRHCWKSQGQSRRKIICWMGRVT